MKNKPVEIYKNKPLKELCTFKIGGNAKLVFVCYSKADLLNVCEYCNNKNIKFKIIGFGANLLFDDNGFDGAIIVNKSNKITFKNNSIYAETGINIGNLINKCYTRSLSGLENFAGIPSTLGGAIVNNLGAFNSEISNFIEYVEAYKKEDLSKSYKFSKLDCNFEYRNSIFKGNDNFIITKVKLSLKPEEKSLIKAKITETISKKSSTQPLNSPSAGSIFKRSNIIPARVIDELGLKGLSIGDAQISLKHSGFIINTGNATCKDVKNLIEIIKKEVYLTYGEILEEEIEFVK